MISCSSFVLFLILTFIILTFRSFLKIKKHRQQFTLESNINNEKQQKQNSLLSLELLKFDELKTIIAENSNDSTNLKNKNKKPKNSINVSVITKTPEFLNINDENDIPKCNCSDSNDLLLSKNLDLNQSLFLFQSETESNKNTIIEKQSSITTKYNFDQKNFQKLFVNCNQIQHSNFSSKDCLTNSNNQKINIKNNNDNVKYSVNNIVVNDSDVNSNVASIVDDNAEPIWQLASKSNKLLN